MNEYILNKRKNERTKERTKEKRDRAKGGEKKTSPVLYCSAFDFLFLNFVLRSAPVRVKKN